MVLEFSKFLSGFEVSQQIVGVFFLIGYIFETKDFLGMFSYDF